MLLQQLFLGCTKPAYSQSTTSSENGSKPSLFSFLMITINRVFKLA
uniref:Uncharacterized protein n=1 Tax=Anguilla anguilla TaxID=7936 RepID=A0A0E9PN60_ANGAN